MNKNELKLKSFSGYCKANPEQRFWQALRNWARENESKDINFIGAGDGMDKLEDTFYWE